MTLARAALWYAEHGFPVFPLVPRTKKPITEHGYKDASKDIEQVKEWWTKHPNANIGLPLGAISGLVCVDMDPRHNGEDALEQLFTQHGRFPETAEQISGGGGRHYLFRAWYGARSSHLVGQGVELKADGVYILVAPSVHPDTKKKYQWDGINAKESLLNPAEAPDWLRRWQSRKPNAAAAPGPIPYGRRDSTLTSLAGSMRRRGMGEDEIYAALAVANNRCVNENGEPYPLPDEDVHRIAASIARYPPAAEPDSEEPPPPEESPKVAGNNGAKTPPPPNQTASAIMRDHSFLSSHEEGHLWRYDGMFWRQSSVAELQSIAAEYEGERLTTSRRRNEIASFIRAKKFEGELKWNQLALPEIPFRNGVFNVESEEFRPHRASDFLDSVIPHNWDPDAKCPLWTAKLAEWLDAAEDATGQEATMLQEFSGYCLLGPLARFKRALIIQGVKHSGKSVLLAVFTDLVGEDFTCSIRPQDMSDPRKLAPIVGKRLNAVPEIDQRGFIADEGFKKLTGGDRIDVDPKHVKPFNYLPLAKHILLCNDLPSIRDYSGAVIDRLILLRLRREFTPEQQDRMLTEKLKAEMPGIVVWAVRGAARLLKNKGRFTIPKSSREALSNYGQEQNLMAAFIEEECLTGPDHRIPSTTLIRAFRQWADRPYLTDTEIRNMLSGLGYKASKGPIRFSGGNRQGYLGLALKVTQTADTPIADDPTPED